MPVRCGLVVGAVEVDPGPVAVRARAADRGTGS